MMYTNITFTRLRLPFTVWVASLLLCNQLFADSDRILNADILAEKFRTTGEPRRKINNQKTVKFQFVEEELVDIINLVAAEKSINVILPTGANAVTSKVTLHIDHLITVDEAWDVLLALLDLADYSMIEKDFTYTVTKNSKSIGKEAMPLYIGVPSYVLPDNDLRIRYLYYFANIKVSDTQQPPSMIATILTDILPDTAIFKFDVKTNALLISDKANNIRSVMTILNALDQISFRETFEVITLRYTNAALLADFFMKTILNPEGDKARYRLETQKSADASFFSRNIKIIPEPRTNTLFVLGREQAVTQIKDFIQKYIDVELESGKSVLHVYQLQYLDAATLEPVLKSLVTSALPSSTGQARGTTTQIGPERFFEGVIIKADVGREGSLSYGGNKIVVAAKNEDWKVIKQLIEELDKPQRTVIIEVLVADLTLEDQKRLGTSLRNPAGLPFPGNSSFQTIHITPNFVRNTNAVPQPATANTLATNLMAETLPPTAGGTSFPQNTALVPGGSTLVSFNDNDGQTWGIAQILKILRFSKILSHPHVIGTNNKEAYIKVGQFRLLPDQASAGTAATTITFTPQEANIVVKITPRISGADTVKLEVSVDVEEWISGNARLIRNIKTAAMVKTEDILALGGLIRTDSIETLNETPVLAKIPLIGWLFKRRTSNDTKTNLTVFISPTIVEPRLRGGVGDYTKDYVKLAKSYSYEGELFESLRDPITRFFFGTSDESQEIVDDFLQKDELKRDIMHLNEAPPRLTQAPQQPNTVVAVDRETLKKAEELKTLVATEKNPLATHPKVTV